MANPQAEPSMDDILASIRRIIAEEDEPATEPARSEARSEAKPEPQPEAKTEARTARKPQPKKPVEPEPEDVSAEAEEDFQAFDEPAEADDDSAEEEAAYQAAEAEAAEIAETEADDDAFENDVDFDVFDEVEETEPESASADLLEDDEPFYEEKPARAAARSAPAAPKVAEKDTAERPSAATVRELTEKVKDTMLSKASAGAAASSFKNLEQNVRIANSSSSTLEDIVERMMEPMLREWLDENLPRIVEDKVEEEVRRLSRRQ